MGGMGEEFTFGRISYNYCGEAPLGIFNHTCLLFDNWHYMFINFVGF